MARQRGLKLGTAIKRLKGKHRIDGEGGDHVVMGAAMGRTGTLVTLVTEVISAADTGPRRQPTKRRRLVGQHPVREAAIGCVRIEDLDGIGRGRRRAGGPLEVGRTVTTVRGWPQGAIDLPEDRVRSA